MSKFIQLKSDFERLINIKFEFVMSDESIINLRFEKHDLQHLLGFHYLSEAHSIFMQLNNKSNRYITAENVIEKLIETNVTFEELVRTQKIGYDLEQRIVEFTYNNVMSLLRGITIFKFIYVPKRAISRKAKFVFIEKRNSIYIQLYIGYDTLGKYYYPVSFQPS